VRGTADAPASAARHEPAAARIRAPRTVALGVFVLLACLHTWPLITNPTHLSRIDNGDAVLNMWTIAWVAHQLPRDILHLFDANIFYPERLTLAYSEAMIVQGTMAIPVLAAGASPVTAFNVVLLAGFALTGWSFCLLLHRWTGSWTAGYVAGTLAAFNSYIFLRLPHLQTQHVEFVALVLFALDRVIVDRRARDAVLLGLAFALQGLTSIYLLVFTTWMVVCAALARAKEWLGWKPRTAILAFLLAAGVAAIPLGPYLLPYYLLHQRLPGFERSLSDAQNGAATWQNYLSTVARLHYGLWSHRFVSSRIPPGFPGMTAIVLAVLALSWRETRRDRRVQMCAAAAIVCLILSVLPNASFFPRLYPLIPGIMAVRVVADVEQIVLLLIAVIAGFGAAAVCQRIAAWRFAPAVALALVGIVNLEARHAPLRFRESGEIPRIYDTLADIRGAVIAELPLHPPDVFFANTGYMLNSTRHWRPMANGYSGYRPQSYIEIFKAIQTFPAADAVMALHDRGITHVVVHSETFRGAFGAERYDQLAQSPLLHHVAGDGDILIYKLR